MDALGKARLHSVLDKSYLGEPTDWEVKTEYDVEQKTHTSSDAGVGMSKVSDTVVGPNIAVLSFHPLVENADERG